MDKIKKEVLQKETKHLNESLIIATEKINRKRASVKMEKTKLENIDKKFEQIT